MQPSAQLDFIENTARKGNWSDSILGSARIPGAQPGTCRIGLSRFDRPPSPHYELGSDRVSLVAIAIFLFHGAFEPQARSKLPLVESRISPKPRETPHVNKFSIFTGSSRTRTPVAW